MTGVVWRDGLLVGRCGACHEFWPLEREFWMPNMGVARCRACFREGRPTRPMRQRPPLTPTQRAAHREYNREWMRRYRREQRRMAQAA